MFAHYQWPVSRVRSTNKTTKSDTYSLIYFKCRLHEPRKVSSSELGDEPGGELGDESSGNDLSHKYRNTLGKLIQCHANFVVKVSEKKYENDQIYYTMSFPQSNTMSIIHNHTVENFKPSTQVPKFIYNQIEKLGQDGATLAKARQQVNGYSIDPKTFYYHFRFKVRDDLPQDEEVFNSLKEKYSGLQFFLAQNGQQTTIRWVIMNDLIAKNISFQNGIFLTDATACTNFKRLPLQILLVADPEGGYQVVAFGMLSSNSTEAYVAFFQKVKELSGNLINPYAIIVDRSDAQIQGIRTTWPNAHIIFCRRHLLASTKQHSQQHSQQSNMSFYDHMLDFVFSSSISEEEFQAKIEQQPEKIQRYYNKELKDFLSYWSPVELAKKGLLMIRTNNPCEGFFGNLKYILIYLPASLQDIIEEILSLTFLRMNSLKTKSINMDKDTIAAIIYI